jgi:hypothetical protein
MNPELKGIDQHGLQHSGKVPVLWFESELSSLQRAFYFLVVLGLELRAYKLSHSTSPFL